MGPAMSGLVNTALALARHDLAVVPLWWVVEKQGKLACACGKADCRSPGKHPIGRLDGLAIAPNGVLSATTETGIVKHWWQLAPLANIGVSTANLIPLDVDVRHDGLQSLNRLEAEHGKLPPTWTVITGSGGLHYYFKRPDGLQLSLPIIAENIARTGGVPPFGDGIDLPGYLVAPPSRHISGGFYQWEAAGDPREVKLAEAPDWIVDRLTKAGAAHNGSSGKSPQEWRNALTGPITAYQDVAAVSIAGLALARIRDVKTAWHFLRTWNVIAADPPLPENDLWKIFDRVADRERAKWQ
jgi:Bifunctional DNA primase/polymerase, N-terminal